MAFGSWQRLSPLIRLSLLAGMATLTCAASLYWVLVSQMHSIPALVWAGTALAFTVLYAATLLLLRQAVRWAAAEQQHFMVSDTVECLAEVLGSAIELRDKESPGHTQRVTDITLSLARQMGLSEQQLHDMRQGCLLHDIGKIGIPEVILLKPAPLTDDERRTMQRHPVIAQEMLSRVRYLGSAQEIPHCHHERWDGSGYPRGIQGDAIPLSARLFAVVDVFDALTSERPYREARTAEYALEYIRAKSGRHFDPRVVELFLQSMSEPRPAL